ncbi:3'-5' exonuclease [Crateriforma conspicua]|uniref:DNA polymerase III subunit epsilon n=1 Tax=Crateriforma conspicua TaxID=2527996 RepID=A0A5C6FZQ6_9PLAN|nr:3'-5' exonuclease [Crateriforma conspicua]TWU66473.1 DNA polymerase III subunit epsilon [Crateriforma conspicua]
MKILAIDTETNSLPADWRGHESDVNCWPRIVQLGWVLVSADPQPEGQAMIVDELASRCELIRPDGWVITSGSETVHGHSQQDCESRGKDLHGEIEALDIAVCRADVVVAHNMAFDWPVVNCEAIRVGYKLPDFSTKRFCTMQAATPVCRIPGPYGEFKWPRLDELHGFLFGRPFDDAHDALADARACSQCYVEMMRRGLL